MKNNKGITLISLIASVMLLFIVSAITITSSINAFNQMKFETAKSEIVEIQKLVDEIATDYETYATEKSGSIDDTTYISYFLDRYNAKFDENEKIIKNISNPSDDIQNLITENPNLATSASAFLFTSDELNKYFNLKGMNDVIVDFSTRTVYSIKGIKDPSTDETYHKQSDWDPNSSQGRKFTATLKTTATVTAEVEKRSDSSLNMKLTVTPNIDFSELYVIPIGSDGTEGAMSKIDSFMKVTTEDDLTNNRDTYRFTLTASKGSKYKFMIVDELNNSSKSSEITIDK